jgi:hypothetical protein
MYAVIYDEHDLDRPYKKVVSVHRTRETAESALGRHRKATHGKRIQECNMRVVWTDGTIKAGGALTARQFETWRPGEFIPEGELHSDED